MKMKSVSSPSLVWPIVFLIAGILLATYVLPGFSAMIYFGLPLLTLLTTLHFFPNSYIVLPFTSLWLFLILGWAITSLQQRSYTLYSQKLDQTGYVSGVVEEISRFQSMDRIRVRIQDERWWSPSHYVIINLRDKIHSLSKGHILYIPQSPEPIPPARYPFEFNGQNYWWLHHTSHQIWVHHASDIRTLQENQTGWLYRAREKAMARIDTQYPDPNHAGILKALVIGDKRGLTDSVKKHFKESGLMHVLAVSGLHVGIVFGLLYILLYPLLLLGIRKKILLVIILTASWWYAFLTGLNIPVIRAVILSTLFLVAGQLRRQVSSWNIYGWAVLIVLVLDPRALFSVSMQLSYGAVAAILWFYKPINNWLTRYTGSNYFTSLTAVSIAAQIGVFPFLMWHFHEVSLVSTISGLLVIPLLFPIILLTTVSIVIPQTWESLTNILSYGSQVLVDLILDISNTLAQWSYSSLIMVWQPVTILILTSAIIVGGIYLNRPEKSIQFKWMRTLSCSLVCLSLLSESGNIRDRRQDPYVLRLDYHSNEILEFYFHGWGYTNFPAEAPLFLKKIRAQHYVRDIQILQKDQEWAMLYTQWTDQVRKSENGRQVSCRVADYRTDEHYRLVIQNTFSIDEPLKNTPKNFHFYSLLKNTINE